MYLTSTDNQKKIPRYFHKVFQMVRKMNCGRVDFVLHDGRVFRAEGTKPGPVVQLDIHNNDAFARLIREGDLGFSDAYLDGWWSTPDLQAFMDWIHTDNDIVRDGFPGMKFLQTYEKLRFWLQSNTKRQAKKNISYHYDLGNDFYTLWLDDTMTYSSGIFDTGQETMEAAQIKKYETLINQMRVNAGDHILEIGCGWGGFAEYAAREKGLKVTGLTISQEQLEFAKQRIKTEGLENYVELKLLDYRDENGKYDGIASIEMFEAVGEKYWPEYFKTIRNCLNPGKLATLQIITIEDNRWESYRKAPDFIQKYIFPGGMLPSPTVLHQEIEKAGLKFVKSVEFGDSYSQTLRRWFNDFNNVWSQITELGFDERFKRMWNFYLTSCAAAFKTGYTDVSQITISNK